MKDRPDGGDQPTVSDVVESSATGRAALVRLDGVRVGTLVERGDESVFTYDSGWLATPHAQPISVTMPLRGAPYISRGLHPFFENLLPEGWLLELSTQKLKISKDDAFGLLIATCADCAGAVEVLPAETEASS